MSNAQNTPASPKATLYPRGAKACLGPIGLDPILRKLLSKRMLKIGIIGDFDGRESHLATNAALTDSGNGVSIPVKYDWIPTESLSSSTDSLSSFDGLICSPGSPYRSMQGALNGIKYARKQM